MTSEGKKIYLADSKELISLSIDEADGALSKDSSSVSTSYTTTDFGMDPEGKYLFTKSTEDTSSGWKSPVHCYKIDPSPMGIQTDFSTISDSYPYSFDTMYYNDDKLYILSDSYQSGTDYYLSQYSYDSTNAKLTEVSGSPYKLDSSLGDASITLGWKPSF